jgi:hypothetical protein
MLPSTPPKLHESGGVAGVADKGSDPEFPSSNWTGRYCQRYRIFAPMSRNLNAGHV